MKNSVLFVDDDPSVIKGLRRILNGSQQEWSVYFADSGQKALETLAESPVDVLVTDMAMPVMDGAALLQQVQKSYPGVVRIILSGQTDKLMALQTAGTAHQLLAKPCSAEKLTETIRRAFQLRALFHNPELLRVITGLKRLPSSPALYFKLVRELESEDFSMANVGDIVSRDMSISARLLQLVNSAYFGLPHTVSSPHEAAMLVGIRLLKSLVLYIQVFSSTSEHPGQRAFFEELWFHSMGVASLASRIIAVEGGSKKQQEDAMIAGILHDIGKLVLAEIPGHHERVAQLSTAEHISGVAAERKLLGATHAEIGAYVLGIWGLPEDVVDCVSHHHCPSTSNNQPQHILLALHAANVIWAVSDEYDWQTAPPDLDPSFLNFEENRERLRYWAELATDIKKRECVL